MKDCVLARLRDARELKAAENAQRRAQQALVEQRLIPTPSGGDMQALNASGLVFGPHHEGGMIKVTLPLNGRLEADPQNPYWLYLTIQGSCWEIYFLNGGESFIRRQASGLKN